MKKLSPAEIALIKKKFPSLQISNPSDLVYEKQIPNIAILLLKGEIALIAKNKVDSKVEPGTLLGVTQLINNLPVKLGCKIEPNSEIIIIQKSDILHAYEDKNSELYNLLHA